ncbi:Hypothetical predicted protein [Podarcis lilfordi]|uniref:Uncharacterized protein n=1 Tax=Podarcis lilfordi TaxID=74358 RepID=A0AA35PQ61_9SAUR|nr:Hypothetical predicted protein [Podarcis lilfordi]
MQLKCFRRKAGGSVLSPVVPLETTLVRPAATGLHTLLLKDLVVFLKPKEKWVQMKCLRKKTKQGSSLSARLSLSRRSKIILPDLCFGGDTRHL